MGADVWINIQLQNEGFMEIECDLYDTLLLPVPQSFDRTFEDHDLQREIERRMSGTFASSGLFSLNMSDTEKAVDVTIDPAASYGCKLQGTSLI